MGIPPFVFFSGFANSASVGKDIQAVDGVGLDLHQENQQKR
jgi:hypothetical protein